MTRRSLTGFDAFSNDAALAERAHRLLNILKWLWLQMRASWLEVMGIYVRSGRDIWRPPF